MVSTLPRAAAARLPRGTSTVVLPVVAAVVLGALVVQGALATLAGVIGIAVFAVLLLRVEAAALVFVAAEPFESYLKSLSSSGVKLLGALVFVAWLLRALSRGRPVRLNLPVLRAAGVLFVVLLAATVLHPNGVLGMQVLTRYLSYLGVLVVLVDCMRDRLTPRLVASVYVLACMVAAVVGLVSFFRGDLRAGGPLSDPNDFAFFLVAAVPLSLGLRRASRWSWLYGLGALVMGLAALATLSRGALVGAAVMVLYALCTGKVRVRAVVAGLALAAAAAGIVLIAYQSKLATSLYAKGQVAQQNVDERLVRWQAAAEMTADHPVLGLGPAGFRENYDRYVDFESDDITHHLDVAHEMYLEVSAELGLPGLAAFGCVMAFGFAGARARARLPGTERALASGVCVATVGTAVAAIFLTEQYFLPVWLLAALGAVLDPRRRVP